MQPPDHLKCDLMFCCQRKIPPAGVSTFAISFSCTTVDRCTASERLATVSSIFLTHSYTVELVEVDNQSSTDKAVTAAQELVSKKISVVLGSYGSGCSIAAAPTFQSASIPAIGCSCTNPAVTEANPDYFRVCFLDPFQGSVMANFAKDEFGTGNAYVLSMLGEDYGSGLATYFVNAFEDLGGTVTSEQFPEGTSDFSAYIKKASDGAFEFVKTQSVEG